MTYKEVATMIEGTGITNAYYQFPKDTEQACPFICYFYTGSNDFAADDSNYQKIRPLAIELYTDEKDLSTEETVESALTSAGLVYSRAESYLDSEKMYMVTYLTDIVIDEEDLNEQ